MKLDESVISEVLSTNWLDNCGKDENLNLDVDCIFIKEVDIVKKEIDSIRWENICLENRNELTMFLAFNKPEIYNGFWNDGVYEIKDNVLPKIRNDIKKRCNELLIENAVVSIESNIVNIIMTLSYRAYFNSPFYENMLRIYKSGHIPCGWSGKLYNGKFKIY